MMKIPKSSEATVRSGQTERAGLNNSAAPAAAAKGKARAGAGGMSAKGTAAGSGNPLALRQNTLDRVLKELASLKALGPGMPAEKALPSLRAFLSLLKNSPPPAGSPDLQLADKFLQGWINKYGADLPGNISREIRYLSRLIRREFPEKQDSPMDGFYLEGASLPEEKAPRWSLRVKREKENSFSEDEEFRSCTLDLNLPELGPVRAILRYGEQQSFCGLYSGRREVRQRIRRDLKIFRQRLDSRGFQNLRLRVGRSFRTAASVDGDTRKEVELWG